MSIRFHFLLSFSVSATKRIFVLVYFITIRCSWKILIYRSGSGCACTDFAYYENNVVSVGEDGKLNRIQITPFHIVKSFRKLLLFCLLPICILYRTEPQFFELYFIRSVMFLISFFGWHSSSNSQCDSSIKMSDQYWSRNNLSVTYWMWFLF